MKAAAIVTNLSILLLFVAAALLNEYSEALYYLSVQEDELLEWATFWGFMVAAAIYFSSAFRQFKAEQFKFGLQMPWTAGIKPMANTRIVLVTAVSLRPRRGKIMSATWINIHAAAM